jgi:hypothetical protein
VVAETPTSLKQPFMQVEKLGQPPASRLPRSVGAKQRFLIVFETDFRDFAMFLALGLSPAKAVTLRRHTTTNKKLSFFMIFLLYFLVSASKKECENKNCDCNKKTFDKPKIDAANLWRNPVTSEYPNQARNSPSKKTRHNIL